MWFVGCFSIDLILKPRKKVFVVTVEHEGWGSVACPALAWVLKRTLEER